MKTRIILGIFICIVSLSGLARGDTPEPNKTKLSSEDLHWLPVKITKIEKQKDSRVIINAQFASNMVVDWRTFVLSNDEKNDYFLKREDGWQREIDRGKFIKIATKDFWMVWYAGGDNGDTGIIYRASQFTNWGELKTWYAQDSDNIDNSAESPTYWQNSKTKTLTLYDADFPNNKIFWVEVDTDPHPLSDTENQEADKLDKSIELAFKNKPDPQIKDLADILSISVEETARLLNKYMVKMAHNKLWHKQFRLNNGIPVTIVDNGTLNIHQNCVFNTIETKESRGLLSLPVISSPSVLMRPVMVKRSFFEANFNKTMWVCVFNTETMTLLRAAPAVLKPIGDNDGQKSKK